MCGFEGTSDVERKPAKKQIEEASRREKKKGSTKREGREMEKEVVVGCGS